MNHTLGQRRQTSNQISKLAQSVTFSMLQEIFTGDALVSIFKEFGEQCRNRIFPFHVTLGLFMQQCLHADKSCQKVVNEWAAQRYHDGMCPCSVNTGGYCSARERLPPELIQRLALKTGELLCQSAKNPWLWFGRRVYIFDGTTCSMPDTPDNQKTFPQPSSQAEGCGFPQARLVGVICLSTGAVIDVAVGANSGKGTGEVTLLRQMLHHFQPGDVVIADALYCNYFLIADLMARGVDVVFPQNGSRKTDFRRGKSLGYSDHIVSWEKPHRPEWMSDEQYEKFPQSITLRKTRAHKRQVLVTTMIDPKKSTKKDLSELYESRWNIEVDFRCLKETMRMGVLNCRSSEMCVKEIWAHVLTYNILRVIMAMAADQANVIPRKISLKQTIQVLLAWGVRGLSVLDNAVFFKEISQNLLKNRKGRIEPRMKKRRPKPYPWLQVPRKKARAHVRRHGHAKRA